MSKLNNPSLEATFALIGRALLALLFIPAGFGKIGGFAGTVGYIASKGIPLPEVAAAIAIVVELGFGILLLIGLQTRWAALGIALFTVIITFIFHPFWAVPAEQMSFFKNMAIAGGAFAFAAFGAGRFSVDARRG
ncbi:MAG: DoxX family protein [Burkholderiales bacterium]|jgi:putative oxidoreductase|nr:DoxX family protein [Burkholderiales bacterium]